ncbi:hypothetical protein FJT64_009071 [Amphibalanus amphitrite]|uniref:SEFIR domain-containing protein n=1 Tax=Amphibalanus amphitrite TaxID=1232801 RepID=A0A6A4VN47_AMPAM|nr:hypothetical protein FJT64_009071 [Amphibalanus amphitrite]KAF0293005.1 hypothetical protein FJT64_009071 [Amphibalanus amphitrite]
MLLKFYQNLTILVSFGAAIFGESHPCHPCDNPFLGYDKCHSNNKDQKIVDFSGVCSSKCYDSARSCSHQIGGDGTECQFFVSSGKGGCSLDEVGLWPVLQCDGQSDKCQCPPASFGHVPLEDDVVITAYPFECDCAAENQFPTTPDILVTNRGWRELAFVSTSSRHEWRCGQFRLSRAAPGRRLRYDCPIHKPLDHGTAVSLQLCTREHTVTYRFQLPDIANISYRSGLKLSSWEPMIVVHTHRSDRLVYSIQRSPPALNISEYDVRLVHCDRVDCTRYHTLEGTERHLVEAPSKNTSVPGVFRVSFDLPEDAGNLSLLVQPRGGQPTLSAVVRYPGKNTAEMAILASVLVLFLVLVIGAFAYLKLFYKPKEPALVEVLVLYNSNASLARHVARRLENHCLVRTRLDVVDIPRASAGMDPVEWLTAELRRCRTVLLLVFPESSALPIYPRIYPSAVHYLQMDAGRTRVVIGHAGGDACAPLPPLPAAQVCRLPAQLGRLARAVRGATWLGRGCMDARELASRLTDSKDGHQLVAMLENPSQVPPPETAPLPVDAEPPPPPELQLLTEPPPRNEHMLAPHVSSTDVLMNGLTPEGRRQTPEEESDGDDDIKWH